MSVTVKHALLRVVGYAIAAMIGLLAFYGAADLAHAGQRSDALDRGGHVWVGQGARPDMDMGNGMGDWDTIAPDLQTMISRETFTELEEDWNGNREPAAVVGDLLLSPGATSRGLQGIEMKGGFFRATYNGTAASTFGISGAGLVGAYGEAAANLVYPAGMSGAGIEGMHAHGYITSNDVSTTNNFSGTSVQGLKVTTEADGTRLTQAIFGINNIVEVEATAAAQGTIYGDNLSIYSTRTESASLGNSGAIGREMFLDVTGSERFVLGNEMFISNDSDTTNGNMDVSGWSAYVDATGDANFDELWGSYIEISSIGAGTTDFMVNTWLQTPFKDTDTTVTEAHNLLMENDGATGTMTNDLAFWLSDGTISAAQEIGRVQWIGSDASQSTNREFARIVVTSSATIDSDMAPGNMAINLGPGGGANAGGTFSLTAGTGGATGNGGALNLTSGDAGGGAADGGTITITAGDGGNSSGAVGGYIYAYAGDSNFGQGAGIHLSAGDGVDGGYITLEPGAGTSDLPGIVEIRPFSDEIGTGVTNWFLLDIDPATWTLVDGATAEALRTVNIDPHTIRGTAGGSTETCTNCSSLYVAAPPSGTDITYSPAASSIMFGKEVTHSIRVQSSTTSNTAGGQLNIIGANGTGSGKGGDIDITAGSGTSTGSGGDIDLVAGAGTGTSAGGNIELDAGDGGTGGAGGFVILTAGDSQTDTLRAGDIALYGGRKTGDHEGDGGAVVMVPGPNATTGTSGFPGFVLMDGLGGQVHNGHDWFFVQINPDAYDMDSGATVAEFYGVQVNQLEMDGVAGGGAETCTTCSTFTISGKPDLTNVTATNGPYALFVDNIGGGPVRIDDSLNVGGVGGTPPAYSSFATSWAGASASMNAVTDLYIQDQAEIDGGVITTTVSATGDITSSDTGDLGWSIVAGANTACNTTCTSACVHGWDTAAGEVSVACADATADKCLCAGGS